MFFSIESRMPFMDHRLIEFNASIPSNFKIYKGWNKYYARIAFQDKLPSEIVWRKDKMGWPSPKEDWLKKPLLKHFNRDVNFLNSCERKFKIKNITIKIRIFMLALFKKKWA
jgi:asparagine synthase (glutamine-hydrolysing)